MRGTMVGLLGGALVAAVVISALADHRDVYGQRLRESERRVVSGDGVTAIPGPVVDGLQLVVLIDNQQQTMGSYFVDGKSGQISLRCVRNFRWDLQMSEFNGSEPSPEKIQALLRSR